VRVPSLLAISPPRPGPWVQELARLAEAGVPSLLLRLAEQPRALAEVLAAIEAAGPPGLDLRLRPFRPEDEELARARGLALHGEGGASRSCHDAASLARARVAGCDFALLSPVFPPGSKPLDARPCLGVEGFGRLARAAGLPVLALGGMSPERVGPLRAAGASGLAGIGAFFREGRVDAAGAREMARAWGEP
jgi:hypothetical protein